MKIYYMKKKKIFDIFVSIGSFSQFIEKIFLISKNKSSYICVCNVHMLVESFNDQEFNEILNEADLVTPDGMPIARFLSWKYSILQQRVSGMDLLPRLINACAKKNKSIYFYGSETNTLIALKDKLSIEHPNLISGFYSPPFRKLSIEEKNKIISRINKFNPDFLFVSLGCPKQEKWMAEHKEKIDSCMIGLGGAFLVYAGLQKRAPKWMRDNSLEWFYRFMLEPRRLFSRYFYTNSIFIWYICKDIIKKYFR